MTYGNRQLLYLTLYELKSFSLQIFIEDRIFFSLHNNTQIDIYYLSFQIVLCFALFLAKSFPLTFRERLLTMFLRMF